MAVRNFNLPFNQRNIQQMPIRNRPDKYTESPLAERFRFEVSEGVRPAEYFGVYKYLPALQKDITTEDYIVIPKGRIVSSVLPNDLIPSGQTDDEIYSFQSMTQSGNPQVARNINDSYFGYDEYMTNLLVPANGGSGILQYYTQADVDAGTVTAAGAYATPSGSFELPANYPVGVAFHDWYQDIRGKYINYRMWPDGGHVLCDWYIEVPYVKLGDDAAIGSGNTPVPTANDYASWIAKFPVNKKFAYLAVESTDTFQPGVWVAPDILGNYKIEGVGNRTIQTIGRLVGIDNRFPKAGMDDVQTYPGSDMPGTQTAGLPSFLFEFVRACQTTIGGTAPTVEEILTYVQTGQYGVARIQLSVA